jgi:flagellar biosynthesis chaperone FliJ
MKAPYEKPEVTTIDLGNLIDEAEKQAAECVSELARIRREAEAAAECLEGLFGDFAAVERQLEQVRKKNLVAQTILGIQEEVHGKEPAGG